jgi:hypothetical protein
MQFLEDRGTRPYSRLGAIGVEVVQPRAGKPAGLAPRMDLVPLTFWQRRDVRRQRDLQLSVLSLELPGGPGWAAHEQVRCAALLLIAAHPAAS